MERHLVWPLQRVVIPPPTVGQPRTHEGSMCVHDDPDDRALGAAILADRLDLDLALPVEQVERLPIERRQAVGGGQ